MNALEKVLLRLNKPKLDRRDVINHIADNPLLLGLYDDFKVECKFYEPLYNNKGKEILVPNLVLITTNDERYAVYVKMKKGFDHYKQFNKLQSYYNKYNINGEGMLIYPGSNNYNSLDDYISNMDIRRTRK